ncbi:MAG: hypothetical protein LBU42_07145, partial [Prevotellaceae bacterium]|nr:hypothetical protein [Prevotellaceae bacterium]
VPQSVELTSLFSTLKTAGITLETALSCTGGYYDSSTQKENGTCAIWSTRARVPTPWPATITATAPSLAVRCVYVGK